MAAPYYSQMIPVHWFAKALGIQWKRSFGSSLDKGFIGTLVAAVLSSAAQTVTIITHLLAKTIYIRLVRK